MLILLTQLLTYKDYSIDGACVSSHQRTSRQEYLNYNTFPVVIMWQIFSRRVSPEIHSQLIALSYWLVIEYRF